MDDETVRTVIASSCNRPIGQGTGKDGPGVIVPSVRLDLVEDEKVIVVQDAVAEWITGDVRCPLHLVGVPVAKRSLEPLQ